MSIVALYALVSVALVSIVSLVGALTLFIKENVLQRYTFILVSLAVGALLGNAFVHLLPEAFAQSNNPTTVSLGVIGGIMVFFVLDRILHWHHHNECGQIHPSGRIILVSDGVHNFIDGIIIGAGYLVSVEVGIATTIAVLMHEVPQEMGDFGVLINAGYTKLQALWWNFVSASVSFAGVLVVFVLGDFSGDLVSILVPIAAGGFIYVAMSDLLPELHKNQKAIFWQLLSIAIGVGAIVLV